MSRVRAEHEPVAAGPGGIASGPGGIAAGLRGPYSTRNTHSTRNPHSARDPHSTQNTYGPQDPHGTQDTHETHETPHEHSAERPPAPIRDPRSLVAAGDLLRALAAPVRIAIVLQLRESGRCVHDLVDILGVTQPLISQHLRVLKAAGVVRGERRGREVVYRLVDEHLSHIVVDAVTHAEELA